MQFGLNHSQNEPMWGFFLPFHSEPGEKEAVLGFVNNLINARFIISACIGATLKHLAPPSLQRGAWGHPEVVLSARDRQQMIEQSRGGEKKYTI